MKETFRFAPSNSPVVSTILLAVALLCGFLVARDLVGVVSKGGGISGLFPVAAILLFFIGYVLYARQNLRVEVSSAGLRINGDLLYGRQIPVPALVVNSAHRVDLAHEPELEATYRINGVGLPGYATGWFKLKSGEKALLFVGNRRNMVYVSTNAGHSLIVSVDEPDQFVGQLRKLLQPV